MLRKILFYITLVVILLLAFAGIYELVKPDELPVIQHSTEQKSVSYSNVNQFAYDNREFDS